MTKEEIREELLASVNAYKNGARDREYVRKQIDYYRTTYNYVNEKEILDMLDEIDKGKTGNDTYSSVTDFKIEGGILTQYNGKGGVVTFPANVHEIADYAFSTNKTIKQLVFQDNTLRKIGTGAFKNCSSLENIELPIGTYLIADDAFLGCTNMKYALIPDSVKYISADVFDKNSRVTVVGESGSEAESYANKNGLYFQTIGDFKAAQNEKATETKKKKDKEKNKSVKSIGKNIATSSETKQAMYYLFLIATIVLTIMTAYYWIKTGTFNDAPYATGPYGTNVVHPVNPYRKFVFICGPLACLSCCLMTNAKE